MSDTPDTFRLFNSYYTSFRFSICTACSLPFRLLLRVVHNSDNTNLVILLPQRLNFIQIRPFCISFPLLLSVLHSPPVPQYTVVPLYHHT